MIGTAVRDQLRAQISAGAVLDDASDALGDEHGLTLEERSVLWLYGHQGHAADPGHAARGRWARQVLEPTA